MRAVLALALLFAALGTAAHADPTLSATITGIDLEYPGGPTENFYTSSSFDLVNGTSIYTVNGTDNTLPDMFTVDFSSPYFLNVTDNNNFFDYIELGNNGNGQPDENLDGSFNTGTFLGDVACSASLSKPRVSLGLPATLAFFQMGTIACGSARLTITANTPASFTPEPSTLALLATGALGVGGILRRRYLASR